MEANPPVDAINTKDIVSKLLETRCISKVIYVDEDFDSKAYYSFFRNFVKFNSSDPRIPFKVIDQTVAENNFDEWWKDSTEEAKMNAIHELSISCEKTDIQRTLIDVFGEERLTCYSPNEFVSFKDSNPIIDEDHQILVLMDQELVGYGKGFDYLKSFESQRFVQCGLFSQTFSIDEEISSWNTICDYSPCVYPLSKSRFTNNDPNCIIEGLRNILWLRQISEIKSLYSDLLSKAVTETSSYLSQLDPATFDYLVMKKSGKEGCWEFETLHRIGCLKLNQLLEKDMFERSFEAFQKQTYDLRVIRQIDENTIPKVTDYAKDINQLDLYLDGNIINRFYSQIGNGDVFQIGEKLFMLLCQPCNLEIRGKGERNEKSFVYLVPMETHKTKTMRELKETMKEFQISNSRIITYQSQEYVLNYSEALPTDIRVLDLVSYNNEGKVTTEIDISSLSKTIQPNMQKRYATLMTSFEGAVDNNMASDEEVDIQTIAIQHGKLDKETINKLSITRVARLKDPRAQECLQELMAYLSRPAYPMDLE